MSVLVSIGDFSRMTYLSIKALRHYHEIGLLEPARVEPVSGYRSYDTAQVAIAQVIRRFRDLGMPLEQVKEVVDAPDLETRNRAIVAHLRRMEDRLAHTRDTIAALRALLDGSAARRDVHYRAVAATPAVAISETVSMDELADWWDVAFDELHQQLTAGHRRCGPDAALYDGGFFETGRGRVTAFVPVSHPADSSGRVQVTEIPAAELAVMTHHGSFADLDVTYGALGTVVAERAVGVTGPIREYYLPTTGDDHGAQRIDVGWPIFRTAAKQP